MMNWKECGKEQSWYILQYNLLGGSVENHEKCQDSQLLGKDSNPETPKYKNWSTIHYSMAFSPLYVSRLTTNQSVNSSTCWYKVYNVKMSVENHPYNKDPLHIARKSPT